MNNKKPYAVKDKRNGKIISFNVIGDWKDDNEIKIDGFYKMEDGSYLLIGGEMPFAEAFYEILYHDTYYRLQASGIIYQELFTTNLFTPDEKI